MKTLELKHLAAYLPYNVQISYLLLDGQKSILDFEAANFFCSETEKLILRPLSDYKEKIKTVDGCDISIVDYCIDFAECDAEIDFINALLGDSCSVNEKMAYAPYSIIQHFCRFHFDVFGLIESGLAIDINTI